MCSVILSPVRGVRISSVILKLYLVIATALRYEQTRRKRLGLFWQYIPLLVEVTAFFSRRHSQSRIQVALGKRSRAVIILKITETVVRHRKESIPSRPRRIKMMFPTQLRVCFIGLDEIFQRRYRLFLLTESRARLYDPGR